jgi:hypothetical protein
MKNILFPLFILLAISITLGFTASPAMADNPLTSVSATETPVCPSHQDCTIGEWTYPNGNIHVRNWIAIYRAESSDPRLTGWNTLIVNANWNADGLGPGWGTFHNQVDAYNGYWEGTWAASMSADGYISRIVGKGYGDLDGLAIHATEVNGVLEGVIIELSQNETH